jgi:hypothetical protein
MRIEEMHFTQIRRRIQKIKSSADNLNLDGNKYITLIVDASGLTITKKGDYTEQKWIREKKRKFVKLHMQSMLSPKRSYRFVQQTCAEDLVV